MSSQAGSASAWQCAGTGQPASIILATSPPQPRLEDGLEIMALFDTLHNNGNTIVLVTHERTLPSLRTASSTSATEKSSPTNLQALPLVQRSQKFHIYAFP